jgi:thiamine-monophosphate kinase
MADIVLLGTVPRGKALLRSGARPGDLLYVTGSLGGAAAGLNRLRELLEGPMRSRTRNIAGDELLSPHLWPQPRIAQGLWLRRRQAATAAIDLSDGLSTDLKHLCDESGVSAEVFAQSLPIHAGATLEQGLHGGEDYELLFTAKPKTSISRSIAGAPVTRIGTIVKRSSAGSRVTLVGPSGEQVLRPAGWQHFS